MNDLVKRLRIKAGMIEMGERIAWGSDSALMREAADALEAAAPDHIADTRKMVAAAVQGEPVAWYLPSEEGYDSRFRDHATVKACTDNPWAGWQPLYATPQPAEQQLDLHLFAKRMDEELEKHYIQGFEPVVLAVAEEVLGYEQQPAPGVSGLVEALEKARDAIASLPKDALGNVPDTQQCQGWHIRDELINDISTALAAHRKGGA